MRWTIKGYKDTHLEVDSTLHEFEGNGPIHISKTFLEMWGIRGVLIEVDHQTPIEVREEADG